MTKKLLTPRGYLSWTQIDLWLRSPETYVRRYMHGDAGFENSAMRFGKKASEALEKGESDDESLQTLVSLLPHYSEREHEIKAPLKTSEGVVILLGKLDTFDPVAPRFREYKTGRVKWTMAKAEKHKQIYHYATLIWLFHKKLPTEAWLDWAETVEDETGVHLTGRIESFRIEMRMQDVLEYMALAGRVAKEIDERYRQEFNNLI